jgi:hypothetical protein
MSWQPLAIVRQTAGALLFVRTWADLGRAIDGVNELRSYRPSRLSPDEEVLGVALCEDVDSIPAILGRVDSGPPHGDLALREAVGLGGVWSLCSFDITLRGQQTTAEHRRRRLLDSLCLHEQVERAGDAVGERMARVRVLPVFSSSEARDDVDRLMDDLTARYPQLPIGPTYFQYDPKRGELVPIALRARASEHDAAGRGGATPPTPTTLTPHLGTEAADDTF